MISRKITSAVFVLLASSSSTWAAATAEEAASILASFQTYVGAEPGVVTVTPAGDAYDIAVDISPYLKKITQPGFTSKVDPFKFQATPKGDGTWAVTSTGPWSAAAETPDVFAYNMSVKNMDWSGTYSTAVLGFLDSKYDVSGISINQRMVDPSTQMVSTGISSVEKITAISTATDAGNGTVDGQSTINLTGLTTSTKLDLPPEAVAAGVPALNYTLSAPTGSYTTSTKGLMSKPLMELAAFFVARPSKELLIKDQVLLKEKLLAAIPVFNSVQGDNVFENATIETGMGKFGIASVSANVVANGAIKDGKFAEQFSFKGLTMPEGLPLPPWSKGLVPTSLTFGFDVTGFDLESTTRKFIAEMDITKPDPVPPGSEMAYLAAFAPTNSIKLTIPPSQIVADLYTLDYEAVNDINFSGLPAVTAKLSLKGMDAVIAQLQQSAADPTAQQALGGLIAMKGLGKADGDKTVWDIVMGADSKLLVNGTDVSAMLGMGPPPQQ